MLAQGPVRPPCRVGAEEFGGALGALSKAVFPDFDIAISVYLDAPEEDRRKTESAKDAADEATERAVRLTA